MSFASIVSFIISILQGIPVLGPVLAVIISYAMPVAGIVSAIVALWHGVVLALQALALIPAFKGLSSVATALQTDENAADSFINTWVTPVLDQLSMIPLPSVPAAPVVTPPASS